MILLRGGESGQKGAADNMEKIGKLFLQAAALGLERNRIDDPRLTQDEWREFMRLSAEQAMLPIVFEAVYSVMPEELEEEYRSVALSWICKQARNTEFFLEIYRKLMELGTEPLVFKGIVCRDTYSLPDWRSSTDEDVYIERDEFMRFHESMKQLGFMAADPNFRSEHETVYFQKELLIEGHWELFPRENSLWEKMNALSSEMVKRAVYQDIEGVRIRTLEPTDHMIYLLLHSMKHFALAGVGIRQICDIVQLDKKYDIDWNRVASVMDSLGGACFTAAILDACCRIFGMRMPEGWEPADSTDLIEDALDGGVFGHSTEDRLHSASITAADGTGHNTVYSLLRTAFPSREVMEINYPWVSHSRLLLPIGWGVRLVQYAKKIGMGNSPIRSVRIGMQRMKLLKQYDIFQGSTERDSDTDAG